MSIENISILDQIINSKKADEVGSLDAVDIINNLFTELSERERDVLIRRHGLHSGNKETLESIGSAHQLTRERIRQIETTSIKRLQQLKNLKNYISALKNVIYQLLEEHGGLMEKEYMLDLLVGFSLEGTSDKTHDRNIHKNYLNFLITKLLFDEFEEINNSKHFLESYKLKYQNIEHFEEMAEELHEIIKQRKQIEITKKIIELIKQLESYTKHNEKLSVNSTLDIAKFLKNNLFEEDSEIINNHKPLYSLIRSHKRISQNKFGHWGHHSSREIKPRTINDKIYLVLKNHGKPMHFAEIAEKINNIGFDHRKANPATVHNELILDKKYVLVGRGLYALKEWGYNKGTVVDVIVDILKDSREPLRREEIIERVLELRVVKNATIILALMNKEKFSKVNGKYIVNA
jgi:hypothetical protein